ncbi:transcriptional regulator [Ensifer sp. Root142]|uniref:GntR family transcriptional regulator n=1 Tax=Ensifer sp. Root142 TaxID=1736461 RepID=UPI00070C3A29|nr:GntR family transcriptional regulator [Ensifer sp. Root142]KQY73141.1 transcriptional regulator [Ensifer sp. Root142]
MYNADETAGAPTAIICEKIWLAIAERRLRPGTRLKEEQLAEIFSVSRARIRQALTALERDGLVTIMPNRGAFVSEPSVDEARDVFVTRRAIEQRVVERLCERATVEDIERMRSHIDEERVAGRAGDLSAIVRLSGGFHLLLAELSGSAFLFGILRDLVSRTSLITAMYRSKHLHNCGPDEHMAVVDCIAARDVDTAIREMAEHLHHVEAELDLDEEKDQPRDLRAALL